MAGPSQGTHPAHTHCHALIGDDYLVAVLHGEIILPADRWRLRPPPPQTWSPKPRDWKSHACTTGPNVEFLLQNLCMRGEGNQSSRISFIFHIQALHKEIQLLVQCIIPTQITKLSWLHNSAPPPHPIPVCLQVLNHTAHGGLGVLCMCVVYSTSKVSLLGDVTNCKIINRQLTVVSHGSCKYINHYIVW